MKKLYLLLIALLAFASSINAAVMGTHAGDTDSGNPDLFFWAHTTVGPPKEVYKYSYFASDNYILKFGVEASIYIPTHFQVITNSHIQVSTVIPMNTYQVTYLPVKAGTLYSFQLDFNTGGHASIFYDNLAFTNAAYAYKLFFNGQYYNALEFSGTGMASVVVLRDYAWIGEYYFSGIGPDAIAEHWDSSYGPHTYTCMFYDVFGNYVGYKTITTSSSGIGPWLGI